MSKIKSEILSLLIVVLITGVAIFIYFFFIKITNNKGLLIYIIYFFLYTAFLLGIKSLIGKTKIKALQIGLEILSIPFYLVLFILAFIQPIGLIAMNFIMFFAIPFLPLAGIKEVIELCGIELNRNVFIYCFLTIFALFYMLFSEQIKKISFLLTGTISSEKLKIYHVDDIINYLITTRNIKFVIYASYFIYISAYSILSLQNKQLFGNEMLNLAVLQSFVTILAFDSMILNSEKIQALPSEVYKKILKGYISALEKYK